MSEAVELHQFKLVPVVELEPSNFSTQDHTSPRGSKREMPDEWDTYWRACLADSGITDLTPICPGEWHIATTEFSPAELETALRILIDFRGGVETLHDPDSPPVLNGGLALTSNHREVLVVPTCCSDLTDFANWRAAASYKRTQWDILWIGHPWLSMIYQSPWLLLSDMHESNEPVVRWKVNPAELENAVASAEQELVRFAKQIESLLDAWNYEGDRTHVSRQFAGLVPY